MEKQEALACLQAIANKDESAMERFYRHFSGAVFQFAMKTVNNPSDAAEVSNEVFLEIWRKAGSFSGQSKCRTWLMSITHHKAVDLVRKKAKHDKVDDIDQQVEQADENAACSLTRAQTNIQNRGKVEHCMGTLKDGHRQVVYLTFFEELAYPEIAAVLSIPAGTVKTRMMHAKKLLMHCLSGLGINSGTPAT